MEVHHYTNTSSALRYLAWILIVCTALIVLAAIIYAIVKRKSMGSSTCPPPSPCPSCPSPAPCPTVECPAVEPCPTVAPCPKGQACTPIPLTLEEIKAKYDAMGYNGTKASVIVDCDRKNPCSADSAADCVSAALGNCSTLGYVNVAACNKLCPSEVIECRAMQGLYNQLRVEKDIKQWWTPGNLDTWIWRDYTPAQLTTRYGAIDGPDAINLLNCYRSNIGNNAGIMACIENKVGKCASLAYEKNIDCSTCSGSTTDNARCTRIKNLMELMKVDGFLPLTWYHNLQSPDYIPK